MADDSGTWSFEYNADGLRVYRSNGTTEYKYYYNGDKLTRMVVNGQNITFGYDANGTPQYVLYDGNRYFYLTNLQGDVTAIVSVNGNIVVEYSYDAWGNVLSIEGVRKDNLGKLNPLRYRGYAYDEETGLYYLQSRYYNPAIGRFINADVYASTGQDFIGNNMFAYCGNSPVSRADTSGYFFFTVLGAAIGGVTGYLDALLMNTDPETGFKSGLVSGAIAGAGVDIGVLVTAGTGGTGVGVGLAIAGTFGAAGSVVGTGISTDWTASGSDYLGSALVGAGMNMISFGLAPITGEIPKAATTYMIDMLMYEGQRCLTENMIAGGAVAVATTWTIRCGSSS